MGIFEVSFGSPFEVNDPMTAESMNRRSEAGAGNLLSNPRFSAARRVDADNATFPWWTTTGNADSATEGKLVLDPGEYAEQEMFNALGTDGWEGQPVVLGAILRVADAAGEATVSVQWEALERDKIIVTQSDLPASYGGACGFISAPADAISATVRVENTGTVGQVEVFLVHFGGGAFWRTPAHPAAAEPVAWLGVLDGTSVSHRGGARIIRVEDIRITPSAASASATATVDLSAVGPSGLVVSGDAFHVALCLDDSTSQTRKTALAYGTVSGTTLTAVVVAHNGLTYSTSTIVCTAWVTVLPEAASVGSRAASKRAYPYG